MASGSNDETVRLWGPATGTLQQTLEGHTDSVWSVVFPRDGRLVASGSYDHTVRLWDPATGALQQTLNVEGTVGRVDVLDFSESGPYLTTNLGFLDIRPWCDDHTFDSPRGDPQIIIKLEHQWVSLNGERLLWLPHEYRPFCFAVNDRTLVLGQASGRVSFIGFCVS